jgi:hypothetical protein
MTSVVVHVVYFTAFVTLYFTPSIVAFYRAKPSRFSIAFSICSRADHDWMGRRIHMGVRLSHHRPLPMKSPRLGRLPRSKARMRPRLPLRHWLAPRLSQRSFTLRLQNDWPRGQCS